MLFLCLQKRRCCLQFSLQEQKLIFVYKGFVAYFLGSFFFLIFIDLIFEVGFSSLGKRTSEKRREGGSY
jgi:hypothetical protein